MSLSTSIMQKIKFERLYLPVIAGILLSLVSCSSESYTQQENEKEKSEQTLSFTEEEDGSDVHYEVNFKDGKISSIYRNNVKVPEDEFENYEDLVDEKIFSLREDHKAHVFHFDMKEFKDGMKEWKDKFKADQFKFKFDNEKFKADMERLKEEMKDMDEIVIKIDKDKIKNELEKIKIHKFDFDFDFDIDEDELNMEDLEHEMDRLNEEMDDLNIEMEELDKEMKILDKFLGEVKTELKQDGFIEDADDEFTMELSENKMTVNGEKVSDALLSKYKSIYKKHYGKEIKDKVKFQIK